MRQSVQRPIRALAILSLAGVLACATNGCARSSAEVSAESAGVVAEAPATAEVPVGATPADEMANTETPTEEPVTATSEAVPETSSEVSEANFTIEGKWKVVEGSFGVASTNSIVIFNGTETNIFSPRDVYALTRDEQRLRLELTGVLGGNAAFTVSVSDEDNISLLNGSNAVLRLARVG